MAAFSQFSHYSDAALVLASLRAPLIELLAHPHRPHRLVGERARPDDIGWRRARRLRLLLACAQAAEPQRWSD